MADNQGRSSCKNVSQRGRQESWRRRYRPYILAAVLAIAMTMFITPEGIEGRAMEPKLNDGEVVICTKESYSEKRGSPELEQVILLEKKVSKKVSYDNIIGRVVGLPGEKIEIRDGKFYRDGKEYRLAGRRGRLGKNQSVKLTKKQVYILSDNLDKGFDSRNKGLGPVDLREIRGNVWFVIWPISGIRSIN